MDGDSIDRVFTAAETRLYRTKVVLDECLGRSVEAGVVPVWAGGTRLGFALVVPDGKRVLAELTIDYASEERLLAETRAQKVYAHPVWENPDGGNYAVNRVVVSLKRPQDDRIKPLGEPWL